MSLRGRASMRAQRLRILVAGKAFLSLPPATYKVVIARSDYIPPYLIQAHSSLVMPDRICNVFIAALEKGHITVPVLDSFGGHWRPQYLSGRMSQVEQRCTWH